MSDQILQADLMDDEGENRAVRAFLLYYGGGNATCPIISMRAHLARSGFDGCWPEWAAAPNSSTLTKAGAQLWLRHLFSLESRRSTTSTQQGDELPPLPDPWEDRESQYETAEFSTIERMAAEIKEWREYGAACLSSRAADARDAGGENASN